MEHRPHGIFQRRVPSVLGVHHLRQHPLDVVRPVAFETFLGRRQLVVVDGFVGDDALRDLQLEAVLGRTPVLDLL